MGRVCCAALAITSLLGVAPSDPGILIVLDRDRFELRVRDERDGARGPRLIVALGSPAHPTPVGVFRLQQIILNPAWRPGPTAREQGAEPLPPTRTGPMGVAKIPFSESASVALHGGGVPLLLGKPITSGCIRAADSDLLHLIDWLTSRGALADAVETRAGEVHRAFRRPVRLRTR
jgi:lipoprotein-anchoring transpeptidase ErfK/SrfK